MSVGPALGAAVWKRARSALFWCHLVTGVAVALVVLLMSVTGVLLTYQRQMTAWADTRGLDASPPSPTAERLPVDTLLARARQAAPGRPTAVTLRADRDEPVEVAFGRERTLFLSAYTGAVLGEGATRLRAFFRTTTDLHRWLAASGEHRATGRSITGAANLGFLFLVMSGFVLWFPRTWTRRAVRNVTLFRRGLSGKARDFNWHNVIGLWSALPLAVVVASGAVISYPWASDLVYRAVGEAPPARAAAPTPPARAEADVGRAGTEDAGDASTASALQPLVARAEQRLPGWRSLTVQLPTSREAPVTVTLDRGTGGQPQARAQLTLDQATAREVRWQPFEAGTRGRQLRSILRFAHTGEVLGLPGQTVAGLVSLGGALLVWTGLALSWRRLASWRNRRRLRAFSPLPRELPARETAA